MENQRHTVLITGTNRGIGLEFVKQYVEQGWRVFAACRKPEEASALQKLAKQFTELTILPSLDVTKTSDIEKMVASLQHQSIDLLINNAGIYGGNEQNFAHVSVSAMERCFLTNTVAPLKISEALLPNLEMGKLKTIATISTLMGSIHENTSGGYYAYRASKAALNMVMKNLSIDLKPKGITVLILHPGWVKTDMGGENAPLEAEQSVKQLRAVISNMGPEKTGNFYSYQGNSIEW